VPIGICNGLSCLFEFDFECVYVVVFDVGGGFGVKVI